MDCLSYVYKKLTVGLGGRQPNMGKVMSSNSGTEKNEPRPSTLTAILFQAQNRVLENRGLMLSYSWGKDIFKL